MQRAYIDALAQLAQSDENVVSVVADNGTDYDWLFQRDGLLVGKVYVALA